MTRRRAALVLLLPLHAACTVGPAYVRPPLVVEVTADLPEDVVVARVDEAVALAEARALGWVRSDPVVVRRLVANLRFLGASAIVDGELRDVEVLDVAADQLSVAFVRGKRMAAGFDRTNSRLTLRFYEGERKVAGASTRLPEDGFAILFDGVDGPALEAALPYLVRSEGTYPPPPVGEAKVPGVDPATRAQWLERVDGLLQRAGTADRWRMARFRGMQDGWFLDVDLVASDAKNHVVGGAHCARLAVELDPAAGIVSLRMVDGVLRQAGGESSIAGEGYRMLLPKLNCKQASDAMMGIVVTK